jgi:hypothetical protein
VFKNCNSQGKEKITGSMMMQSQGLCFTTKDQALENI